MARNCLVRSRISAQCAIVRRSERTQHPCAKDRARTAHRGERATSMFLTFLWVRVFRAKNSIKSGIERACLPGSDLRNTHRRRTARDLTAMRCESNGGATGSAALPFDRKHAMRSATLSAMAQRQAPKGGATSPPKPPRITLRHHRGLGEALSRRQPRPRGSHEAGL